MSDKPIIIQGKVKRLYDDRNTLSEAESQVLAYGDKTYDIVYDKSKKIGECAIDLFESGGPEAMTKALTALEPLIQEKVAYPDSLEELMSKCQAIVAAKGIDYFVGLCKRIKDQTPQGEVRLASPHEDFRVGQRYKQFEGSHLISEELAKFQ